MILLRNRQLQVNHRHLRSVNFPLLSLLSLAVLLHQHYELTEQVREHDCPEKVCLGHEGNLSPSARVDVVARELQERRVDGDPVPIVKRHCPNVVGSYIGFYLLQRRYPQLVLLNQVVPYATLTVDVQHQEEGQLDYLQQRFQLPLRIHAAD